MVSAVGTVKSLGKGKPRMVADHVKWSLKVIRGHVFWGQWKGDKGLNSTTYIIITLASSLKALKTASESPENPRCRLPHCCLTKPLQGPGNACEYPHKPYITRI